MVAETSLMATINPSIDTLYGRSSRGQAPIATTVSRIFPEFFRGYFVVGMAFFRVIQAVLKVVLFGVVGWI